MFSGMNVNFIINCISKINLIIIVIIIITTNGLYGTYTERSKRL